MDRRYDKLFRSHEDDPEQLYQRVVDDRDLLGFEIVCWFLMYNNEQYQQLFDHFRRQIEAELCDCGRALDLHYFVASLHPEDCNFARAWQDMQKTWGSYLVRKKKEFREARRNR